MWNPISTFFGLLGRLFESGSEKIEDPTYALERAYRQQLKALDETRRGRIEVETIGARLELELRLLDLALHLHRQQVWIRRRWRRRWRRVGSRIREVGIDRLKPGKLRQLRVCRV